MNAVEYWLNECRQKKTYKSENALARDLGISGGLLGNIKIGRTRMPPKACEKIATITGEEYAVILLSIMADKTKDEKEGKALFSLIKRANPSLFKKMEEGINCILCKIEEGRKVSGNDTLMLTWK